MRAKKTDPVTKPKSASNQSSKTASSKMPGFAEQAMVDADQHRAACRLELERLVSQSVDDTTRARWEREAAALPAESVRYPGPWSVLIAESYDVLRFMVQRWHPRSTPGFKAQRPGLVQVAPRLSYAVADEIAQLALLASDAQRAVYLRNRGEDSDDAGPQAQSFLGDLLRALTFLLDDGVEDASDAALAELRAAHDSPDLVASKLAAALSDYAAFAQRHRDGLAAIGFDLTTLDAIPELVRQLRVNPGAANRTATTEADADLRDRRDRLATLLYGRVRRVRSAAHFVFAKYPRVVREVTSAYQRQSRAARRTNGGDSEKAGA